jgi:hypothetical protein
LGDARDFPVAVLLELTLPELTLPACANTASCSDIQRTCGLSTEFCEGATLSTAPARA